MKLPCELIVMHVLPTARGALAKELVGRHGMTQVQVAALFGVTNAAVSQYLKAVRGGNSVIDRSEYRSDF
ncbi:MAG: transcriptional regulator, partial [Candidatus Methanomethylophilaceae archaeon]|nr:transcriptional regulator [Candidatus Methanomethylophilaceae archaeon]